MCLSLYLLLNIYPPLIIIKKKLNMRLNKTEREALRKRVEIVIPQMKKSKIVNHFQKEGYRCVCSAAKNSDDNFTKNRNFDD